MKRLAGLSLALAAALLAGCAAQKKAAALVPAPAIVTTDTSLSATVAMYEPGGRFVVLSFPSASLPKRDQVLFVYHGGMKAGEVKITGPEHENNVVADLVSGAAQTGDEVRDQ